MNHRISRLIFAFAVGLLVAYFAFTWISDPAPRAERQLEESVVLAARQRLQDIIGVDDIELVDPLATNRAIGKTYVYRAGEGWEVSGYYRRGDGDRWHPFLMRLDAGLAIVNLKVQDKALAEQARTDSRIEVLN
jgi:hypothetical protein